MAITVPILVDILVAAIAIGSLTLAILERKSRLRLEQQLNKANLVVQTRISHSHVSLSIENIGSAAVQITAFTLFVDDQGYPIIQPDGWIQIIKAIGLTSPSQLELDAHIFGLPLTIQPGSGCYLIRGEFKENDVEILKALHKIKVKITSLSILGIKKTTVSNITFLSVDS